MDDGHGEDAQAGHPSRSLQACWKSPGGSHGPDDRHAHLEASVCGRCLLGGAPEAEADQGRRHGRIAEVPPPESQGGGHVTKPTFCWACGVEMPCGCSPKVVQDASMEVLPRQPL